MSFPSRPLGAAMLVLLLAGCASRPAAPPPDLAGRLAIKVDGQSDRNLSASFELGGTAREGRLQLGGPLGTTAAQAGWAPGEAWIVAEGKRTDYPDLDSLATATLGEAIPIAALFDWLRGKPWDGAPSIPRVDGRPGFEQLDWRIDLSRFAEGWLEAVREAPPMVSVRARLDRP